MIFIDLIESRFPMSSRLSLVALFVSVSFFSKASRPSKVDTPKTNLAFVIDCSRATQIAVVVCLLNRSQDLVAQHCNA